MTSVLPATQDCAERPEPLVTTQQTADFLGHPAKWLQRNAQALGIPRYRVGNQYRYRLSEVAAWVDAQAVR